MQIVCQTERRASPRRSQRTIEMNTFVMALSVSLALSACTASNRDAATKSNVNSSVSRVNQPSSGIDVPYSEPKSTRPSKSAPTAIEVAQVLKKYNIFPKSNRVTENQLTDLDRKEGLLTSVNIASARVEGMTIKVYQSIGERNQ